MRLTPIYMMLAFGILLSNCGVFEGKKHSKERQNSSEVNRESDDEASGENEDLNANEENKPTKDLTPTGEKTAQEIPPSLEKQTISKDESAPVAEVSIAEETPIVTPVSNPESETAAEFEAAKQEINDKRKEISEIFEEIKASHRNFSHDFYVLNNYLRSLDANTTKETLYEFRGLLSERFIMHEALEMAERSYKTAEAQREPQNDEDVTVVRSNLSQVCEDLKRMEIKVDGEDRIIRPKILAHIAKKVEDVRNVVESRFKNHSLTRDYTARRPVWWDRGFIDTYPKFRAIEE